MMRVLACKEYFRFDGEETFKTWDGTRDNFYHLLAFGFLLFVEYVFFREKRPI